LVGIAVVLSYLARSGKTLSQLKSGYTPYVMAKTKIILPKEVKVPALLEKLKKAYSGTETDTRDGLKIIMPDSWIHLRASNTEPIVRIYSESRTAAQAEKLAEQARQTFLQLIEK
jgi:phosphomannomutase